MPTPDPPLAHVRAVDLTDLRGALAGRMLSELGADVVKVEPPGGDRERAQPPRAGGDGTSLAFLYRHAGKRGAVADLAHADGRARVARLCDRADLLLENLDADLRAAAGLDPHAVAARHPRLVHVAIADCGLSGPRAGWRLEPLPALAASGALFASGPPRRPPCGVPGHLAHDCAAVVAVVGALAALRDRAHSGRGQTVEVSVEEAALAVLAPWGIPLPDYAARWPVLPDVLPRDGDGPEIVVPVRDGWVRLVAVTPSQWRGLIALLAGDDGAPAPPPAPPRADAATRPGLAPLRALVEGGEHLGALALGALARLPVGGSAGLLPAVRVALEAARRVATAALADRPLAEVLAAAQRLRVPMAPVQPPRAFVACEQARTRGAFIATGFPELGDAPVAVFPARLSATPAALRRPAPPAGRDDGDFADVPPAPAAGGATRGLTGIRVVDLGVGAVGPELCRQLAELGADVVKVEVAASPDFLRRITVEPATPNRSWMFNDADRGRRSVRLDLRTDAGRRLARRLCLAADVVAENRAEGVVERWGLGWDALHAERPDLIYVSSQGYGRGGPLAGAPAYGPLAAAFAGVSWLWSHADEPVPTGTSLEHPDHFAGRLLAVAVLAALAHRDRSGQGQRIDCAQTEAAAYPLGHLYLCADAGERGNASTSACPHGVYPAHGHDRWLALAVVGDDAWQRFRTALGWPDEPALATLAGRRAHRAGLDERVAAWTRAHDAMAAATLLQAGGVSAMPVQDPHALRADPHLAARGALVTLDDPEVGPVRHVGSPLRMSATPAGAAGPAPALGADADEVLAEWLGLDAPARAALRAAGAVA